MKYAYSTPVVNVHDGVSAVVTRCMYGTRLGSNHNIINSVITAAPVQ